MSEAGEIGIGAPPARDIQNPLEIKRDSREDVISALNSASELLDKTPQEDLTPDEQWVKESAKGARNKTIDEGKDTFTNSFENHHTGETFVQEEGIPIEGLLSFLKKRAESLPADSDEKKDLIRTAHILYRNSQPYHRFPHRMEPSQFEGRVHHEAYFISKDSRTTGNENEDWFKAIGTLNGRLELVIPKDKEVPPLPIEPTTPVPETAEPAPAEPATDEVVEPASSEETPIDTASAEPESVPEEVVGPEPESESETIPEPESEDIDKPNPEEPPSYTASIVPRTEDYIKTSYEQAENLLQQEMRRGSFLNPLNWGRKIGVRIMEHYWRQKTALQLQRIARESNNSYLQLDLVRSTIGARDLVGNIRNIEVDTESTRADEEEAGGAILRDIASGVLTEGQTGYREAEGELKRTMLDEVIRPIVDGTVTSREQVQEILRTFVAEHQDDVQVREFFGNDASQYGRMADYFATDLLEVGEAVRTDLQAHRFTMEQLDNVVKIQLGNTTLAAETQVNLNMVDRAIRWAESHRITGTLINPATIGMAFSLGTFALTKAPSIGSKALWAVPGAGMIAGATFAAFRRNYDLKVDRASAQIATTYSQRPEEGARRREAMGQFSLNVASVDELRNGGGQDPLTGTDRESLEILLSRDLSEGQTGNRENVIRRMAETIARLDFSVREKVDLITFESKTRVQQGRLAVKEDVVRARQVLRNAGMSDEEIQEIENRFIGEYTTSFTQNREQQDRAFARYRLRNAAGAAVFGGAVGLGMGFGVREGLEELRINPVGGAIDKVRELLGHHEESSAPNAENFKDLYSHGGSAEVNDHFKAVVNPADHTVSIIDSNTNEAVAGLSKITLAPDGHMTAIGDMPPKIHDELQQAGFSINQGPDIITHSSVDVLTPSGTHVDTITGHSTTIPNGTEWIHDPSDQSKWDLVVSGNPDKTLISDAQFDATGKIVDWDHANSMDSIISVSDTTGEPQIITGGQAVDEWLRHGTQIDHREWYSYDQPESQGNELRLYDFKQGDSVVLDMNKMGLAYQQGLTPNPISVQDVISNHESGFAFSLPGHEGQPVWIPDGADGQWDGLLHLNPNDTAHFITMPDGTQMPIADFSKMVVNQDLVGKFPDGNIASELYSQQDIFRLGADGKMGFIEAGRMVDQNGAKVLQAFATIRGSAEAQAVIPGNPVPVIDLTGNITETVQVTTPSFDIIPPGEHPEIPIIPIPFAPRHPLEPLRRPPDRIDVPPYGYGYHSGELSPELAEFYRSRRSARLRNNPDAILDPSIEIPDYFSRMSPEYIRELEDYLAQGGMRETMSENANLVVAIPVYDLGEGQIIRNTLEQYLLQIDNARNKNAINSSRFEIILFLNHPRRVEGDNTDNPRGREALDAKLGHSYRDGADDRVRSGKPDNYDTEEVIRQFQEDHPEIKVRVMTKEFETRSQWSDIIKPLYDIALLRSARRQNPYRRDISIVTNDADVVTMSPTYIKDLLDTATENEDASKTGKGIKLDAFAGKTDMPNHGFKEAPGFLAAMRFWQFTASQLQRRPGWNPPTQGRNTVIRGSAYAAIGGVNNQQGYWVDAGADTELGKMISIARGGEKTIKYINRAWLNTDPRREFGKWQQGIPLVWAWDEWAAMNVYGDDWKNQIKIANPDPSKISKENLEGEINANMRTWGLSSDSKELRRSLAWIGFKLEDYHFEEFLDSDGVKRNKILIDNIDGVVTNLEAYIRERRWETTENKIKKDLKATSRSRSV